MKIAMSSGHGKYIRGASGYPVPPQLDEVDEARRVVDRAAQILNAMDGVTCVTFHDNTSHDQSTNLETITAWHNKQTRDYDVSVHFNAYDGSANGCEVLYVTQESLAGKLSGAIAAAGGFSNRGAKYRSDLYVLNNTNEPAVLIETCFCDHTGDSNAYNAKFEKICEAIAETITGQQAGAQAPIDQPPAQPPSAASEARVDIVGKHKGSMAVYINDTLITGDRKSKNVLSLKAKLSGDVVVTINGEEFHNKPKPPKPPKPGIKPNHTEIEATVFGGSSDPNNSAYPPYAYLNDTDLYVALPYSFDASLFPDNPPMVRVVCGAKSAVARIGDKGPWTTDDVAYVDGAARPIAEQCYEQGKPLPSGPNKGKVPTNKAGIDLSPALAKALGVSGKGIVSWEFVDSHMVA